jgi:CRISP-associated protein Cas1
MSEVLNTLFVTAEHASLRKDHGALVVRVDDEEKLRLPLLHLKGVVCFGAAWVSPELMSALVEQGAHLAFLDHSGHMLARVEGIPGGNVLLRRAQFRAADSPEATMKLAKSFVIGKVFNQRQVLLHAARDSEGTRRELLKDAATKLAQALRALDKPPEGLEALRGLEGISARNYFEAFPQLLRVDDLELAFNGRSRRPPRDRINALLSFGYALLLQDCIAACCAVGLDPAVGYLHEDRPGRLGLALDLMEELRAPVVDRLVLALVNRGQLKGSDVAPSEQEGFLLSKEGRKVFVTAYRQAQKDELTHQFLERSVAWGEVPHLQALLLARTLRGDLDAYPPFAIR